MFIIVIISPSGFCAVCYYYARTQKIIFFFTNYLTDTVVNIRFLFLINLVEDKMFDKFNLSQGVMLRTLIKNNIQSNINIYRSV